MVALPTPARAATPSTVSAREADLGEQRERRVEDRLMRFLAARTSCAAPCRRSTSPTDRPPPLASPSRAPRGLRYSTFRYPPVGTKAMDWDLEVDLVAVGSGLGGTCAAIAAHDLGLARRDPRQGAEARRCLRVRRRRSLRAQQPQDAGARSRRQRRSGPRVLRVRRGRLRRSRRCKRSCSPR